MSNVSLIRLAGVDALKTIIRDYFQVFSFAANGVVDMLNQQGCLGLDLQASSSVANSTLAIDGQSVTLTAGATPFTLEGVPFDKLRVTVGGGATVIIRVAGSRTYLGRELLTKSQGRLDI